MKQVLKAGLFAVTAFAVGFGINNFAMSDVPANYKVAVIDVNTVVQKSAQVQALKKEEQQKMSEYQTWLKTVNEDVQKQQTKEGKEKLLKKYNSESTKKLDAIRKNYASKWKEIDKSISATIAQEAKNNNYNLVLAKGSVLYGGDDITSKVAKAVK